MSRLWLILSIVIALTGSANPAPANDEKPNLAGRMLVAGENVLDPVFKQTVIYLLEHNAKGAVGMIINRVISEGVLNHLLKDITLTRPEDERLVSLHFGGPVSTGRVFILHSPDFKAANTFRAPGGLAITSDQTILDALVRGEGPIRMKVMIGYSGWGPGQLEKEVARGDWLNAPADENFVFDVSSSDVDLWNATRDLAGLTL
jgi:putative transcriptional regulator